MIKESIISFADICIRDIEDKEQNEPVALISRGMKTAIEVIKNNLEIFLMSHKILTEELRNEEV